MVGAIGNWAGSYNTAIRQQMQAKEADRVLQRVDTNQDGKVTEAELSKALQANGNKQGVSAAELFKQLDQGGKGYITRQDLEDGLAKAEPGTASLGQAPSGRAGRGGAGGGDGDAAGGASTTTAFDPEDLNQDGKVTNQERIEYMLKVYAAQKEAGASQAGAVYS